MTGRIPGVGPYIESFLSGRAVQVPEGLETLFGQELKGVIQDMGVSNLGFTAEELAGELAGLAEGGLIVGKGQQIVESLGDLIRGSTEAERQRKRARDQLARERLLNPPTSLPAIGHPQPSQAFLDFFKTPEQLAEEKQQREEEFKGFTAEDIARAEQVQAQQEQQIRQRKPFKEPEEEEKQPFIDIELGEGETETVGTDIDPETGQPQGEGPPLSAKVAGGAGISAGVGATIASIKSLLEGRGLDKPSIDKIIKDITGQKDKPSEKEQQDKQIADILNGIVNPRQQGRRPLDAQSIGAPSIFKLPPDTESYSYVDLVRHANANYQYNNNLFNTKF